MLDAHGVPFGKYTAERPGFTSGNHDPWRRFWPGPPRSCNGRPMVGKLRGCHNELRLGAG